MDEVPNLLRVLGGQLQAFLVLTVSHDSFGKPFFQLTDGERTDAEATASALTAYYARLLTPERIAELLKPQPPPKIQ